MVEALASEVITMKPLAGKSIVITGAARGIGAAIAEGLAGAGACVTIGDVQPEAAEATAARIRDHGGQAIGVAADVRDRAAVADMIKAAVAAFGPLYGMVNNAGIAQARPFIEITEADWRRVMEVNSLGVLVSMQEAAKVMMAQKSGGRIVNVASIAGKQGYEPLAHYSASKFSVVAFTQAGAKALGPHGINVNAICPGIVATPMWQDIGRGMKEAGLTKTDEAAFDEYAKGILLGRSSTPQDLIGIMRFLMSADSAYMTGQSLVIDGGMVFS